MALQNEPVYAFSPKSKERADVAEALKLVQSKTEEVPIVIGGEKIWTEDVHYQVIVRQQREFKMQYDHNILICFGSHTAISKKLQSSHMQTQN